MEFKFLMFAIILAIFPIPTEASSKTCPRWVKLNKSPVCFGAKGDDFGRFSYHRNIFVSSFMLVHRSGTVTCDKKGYSYWGCAPNVNGFSRSCWPIRTTRYWLQKHQHLSARVDGTIWPDQEPITVLPPRSLCSVPKRSLNVSLLTVSCVCGMVKICAALIARVTMGARPAQMCTDSWRKTTKTKLLTWKCHHYRESWELYCIQTEILTINWSKSTWFISQLIPLDLLLSSFISCCMTFLFLSYPLYSSLFPKFFFVVNSFPECPEDHEMTYRWEMKKLLSGVFGQIIKLHKFSHFSLVRLVWQNFVRLGTVLNGSSPRVTTSCPRRRKNGGMCQYNFMIFGA